jgi:NADH dehydrogenase
MDRENDITLIVGASSRLGQAVTRRLLAGGHRVRLMTRNPANIPIKESRLVQIATGDLRNPASVSAACKGVTQVFASAHSFMGIGANSPDAVDGDGNHHLIDAAKSNSVRFFVFTSILGVNPNHGVDVFRIKYAVEQHLQRSGLAHAILRPTAFMESWTEFLGRPVVERGLAFLPGRGENQINFVAVDDVAEMAASILNAPGLSRIIEIGGPENLTLNQVVQMFERISGRRNRSIHIPVPLISALSLVLRPFLPALSKRVCACVKHMDSGAQVFASTSNATKAQVHTRFESVARAWFAARQTVQIESAGVPVVQKEGH